VVDGTPQIHLLARDPGDHLSTHENRDRL
jgi:hypothetical protein